MPEKYIPTELRRVVTERAGQCCEYCRSQTHYAGEVTFTGSEYARTDAAFRPLTNGTSVLSVETPAGFSTSSNVRQITATIGP